MNLALEVFDTYNARIHETANILPIIQEQPRLQRSDFKKTSLEFLDWVSGDEGQEYFFFAISWGSGYPKVGSNASTLFSFSLDSIQLGYLHSATICNHGDEVRLIFQLKCDRNIQPSRAKAFED